MLFVFVRSFPRVRRHDAVCNEKGKPAGRKFITREQQVITLKADFSEQLRGSRKESATEPPRGFRVNGGNLRPANGAGRAKAPGDEEGRERWGWEARDRGSVGKDARARQYGAVKKSGEKD